MPSMSQKPRVRMRRSLYDWGSGRPSDCSRAAMSAADAGGRTCSGSYSSALAANLGKSLATASNIMVFRGELAKWSAAVQPSEGQFMQLGRHSIVECAGHVAPAALPPTPENAILLPSVHPPKVHAL